MSEKQLTGSLTALAVLTVFAVVFALGSGIAAGQSGIDFTFTNSTTINIPEGGAANPYPSVINVVGVPNQLAKVTVRLNSFGHSFPSDLDLMLVGPQGQTAMIMSDVGGGTLVAGLNITLDDAATLPLPTSALSTGTFRPTNLGAALDPFPAPAPAPTLNAPLSVFQGTNPNGEWRLFVVDDVAVDAGTIVGGWTITITAAISGQNTGGISIPESGVASPYPSEINVVDHINPVARVQVNLVNFTHASPDDVDVLLVSPSGRSVVLMSDVGGSTAATGLNLSFDDFATNSLPDNGAFPTGLYKPTDFEPGDIFPSPAPSGPPTGRTLSSLNGSVANGAWKLFIVDDAGNNVGSVTGGWSILVGTSDRTISVEGSNVASPYPSEIQVSGLPGSITRATVTISNFSHLAPDNVDILLVGPDGRRIVLMSDAGGQNEVGGINLTFDDTPTNADPDGSPLTGGTFRPADYEPGEVFPAPAPSGPVTGTTLNAFYGGVPNGTWRLYVVGDGPSGSFGSIASAWSVSLQTSTGACVFTISPPVQAVPAGGGIGAFNITQPNGCAWSSSTTDPFITILSGSSGGGNGSVSFAVDENLGPARTGTITVSNGITTRTFQVQQPSGCPLSVGATVVNFSGEGGAGNVNVVAGGGCSWQGATFANWIQITSGTQSGNGTLTFNVQPNTARTPRSATIDVGSMTILVNQAPLSATRFDYDGDGRTDISVFRPSTRTWWIAPSGAPGSATANQFGLSTDRIVPADYDGDLKTDIAVYRDGTWYVLSSSNSSVVINNWGTPTDIPVPADYNSDGSAELAVYRPSTGEWWILNSNGTHSATAFGLPTDVPTPGDYDGDGKTDLSVYRGASVPGQQGTWWVLNSTNGFAVPTLLGVQGDIAVPADYEGDGRDNIAVFRPSTGVWYRSTNAATNYDAVQFGLAGDSPVPGDYDGDGRADPAVVRFGSNAVWYTLGSTSGVSIQSFGLPADRPTPGAYVNIGLVTAVGR